MEELDYWVIIQRSCIGQFNILEITMPVYDFICENGHRDEFFVHVASDLGCKTNICLKCKSDNRAEIPMFPIISYGKGLLWFSEKSPRILWNLGPAPVTVRSHEEHKRLMREAGVVEAGSRRGERGTWT